MQEFLISGTISKIENKTSKSNSQYSLVYIQDQASTLEVVAGKVEVPTEGSTVLCRGAIRSTPRTYQDRVFYSYSFLASKFEILVENKQELSVENSLPEPNFADVNIPF